MMGKYPPRMADKCALCNAAVEQVFLEKVQGTYVKDAKGKKRLVCSACQAANGDSLRAKLG